MSARILRLIVISVAAMMVGACGGSASASSPASPSAPIGGPVRTESDAVARVIASEPRFSGITARDPGLIGQAAWYEVTPASWRRRVPGHHAHRLGRLPRWMYR
jgi:hypothetical protein